MVPIDLYLSLTTHWKRRREDIYYRSHQMRNEEEKVLSLANFGNHLPDEGSSFWSLLHVVAKSHLEQFRQQHKQTSSSITSSLNLLPQQSVHNTVPIIYIALQSYNEERHDDHPSHLLGE